jgi:NADPH:quinone reductase-like Zn-dependent oxidoreductase
VIDDALALEQGEWLLVNGASGVTGSLLLQLGVARGAAVIATASGSNAPRLLRYGAREVVDYHDEEWPDLVREITGGEGVAKTANAARGGAVSSRRRRRSARNDYERSTRNRPPRHDLERLSAPER